MFFCHTVIGVKQDFVTPNTVTNLFIMLINCFCCDFIFEVFFCNFVTCFGLICKFSDFSSQVTVVDEMGGSDSKAG